MYIVNETYFPFIPNLDELRSKQKDVLERIIDGQCRLLLKNALGNVLFSDFDTNIQADGIINPSAPQKWLNLVNGVQYSKNGTTFDWQGLTYTEGTIKNSLLVPYVYYYWLLKNQSVLSGTGEVVIEAKNAVSVNSTQSSVTAWNNFVSMYQCDYDKHPVTYYHRGVHVIDWLPFNNNTGYVSLIKFLQDNETDYPDASLVTYDFQNQLGI